MESGLITLRQSASEGIERLLRDNIIGTPGKSMVYRHQRVSEKLNHIPDPWFASLELRGKTAGTACFCRRSVYLAGVKRTAFYIRYFTFKKAFRSTTARRRTHESALKKEIRKILSGAVLPAPAEHLFYAYVDPQNERSLRLIEDFGFKRTGSFQTVFFSRFSPRSSQQVQTISPDEREKIRKRLQREYRSVQLLSFENVFYADNYFIYREEGKAVAGLQASPEKWEILELPGRGGPLLLKVMSGIPGLKRLFGSEFSFLSIEGVFCDPGKEACLEILLQDVLKRFGCYTAILCLDPETPQYRMLKSLDQGWMGRLIKEKSMSVMVKANGISPDELTGPSYISSFDVM